MKNASKKEKKRKMKKEAVDYWDTRVYAIYYKKQNMICYNINARNSKLIVAIYNDNH